VIRSLTRHLGRSWRWLRWVVAIGLLAWLFYGNRAAVAEVARGPKAWGFLALASLTLLATYLLTFARWWVLVRAQRLEFPLGRAFRLGFIGLVANYVAPGAVGGDVVKTILMVRDQPRRRTVAVATVILDRIVGMLGLFLVGSGIALVPSNALDHPDLAPVRWLMWGGSVAGVTALVLMLQPWLTRSRWVRALERLPRVGGFARELIEGVGLYQSRPGAVWLALGMGVACQCGLIVGFYLCARWMRQAWTPDLATHFFFLPTTFLFGAFVPVPAGMGALEGAVQWFYERVRPDGITAEAAGAAGFLAALAFRIVTMAIAAIGGGYYLTARGEIAREIAAREGVGDGEDERGPPPTAESRDGVA